MARACSSRVIGGVDRDTELALVERLRQGDADAFDEVYAAFNTRLFTFLVRLSRRREVAEDLLEETWLRLVKHARRLRADTRIGPWLFTVARNLHVSFTRSRMLEDSAAATLIALWPYSLERSSPFEAAAASELGRRIEQALAAMPTASREVLLLVGVAGLDHSDVADICGITPEALRQRLHRARETLSKLRARGRGRDSGAERNGVMSEPLIRLLAELPLAEPDPARAERNRMRCRARLARQTPRASASRASALQIRTAQVWQPLIVLLGAAYLTAVIVQALRVYEPCC
ncbi:MAG TPA: sigma-70 family RNA polymerase sigma factor [Myxococcaceae bacterium]|nr:sigma-70 family RNA polymerase sigma factor [Myxococcaceae bacterium]